MATTNYGARFEHATAQPFDFDIAKEPLDYLPPRSRGGHEVDIFLARELLILGGRGGRRELLQPSR